MRDPSLGLRMTIYSCFSAFNSQFRVGSAMSALQTRWTTFIDGQHRYPTGIAGQLIGRRMLRQHAPETRWTISTLDIQPTDRVLEVGFGAGHGLALAAQQ